MISIIKKALAANRIEWKSHSLKRMFERSISKSDVMFVLNNGEIIEDYPDDSPFPSLLMMGLLHEAPLHVVIAFDRANEEIFVITAYVPDKNLFNDDYRTRRKP